MLTGEMNTTGGARSRKKISQTNERPRAARPLIFGPAFRRTLLKVFRQARKHRTQLSQSRTDAFGFFHLRDPLGLSRARVGHENAAWPRLVPGGLPNFDGIVGEGKAVQTLLFPRTLLCLQVHARNKIIFEFFD